ncbi:PEP-CTERM sorting domain-containing protein [Oscillatoria amoena NRMC-F 0135]|nr:PEP-CTERM sorting domain-containing protein [Oscillatoria amoena NRMC-F 0135]
MNTNLKIVLILIAAAGWTLSIQSLHAAPATTTTNSLGTAGYALNLRFDTNAVLNSVFNSDASAFDMFAGGQLSADGQYLLQTWASGLVAKTQVSDGTIAEYRSGYQQLVNVGGYYFAMDGSSSVARWTEAQNITTDGPSTSSTGGFNASRAASAVIGGTDTLFLGNGLDIRRFTVNGDGSLTDVWGSSSSLSIPGGITGMHYVPGRGLYAATDDIGFPGNRSLFHISDSGVVTEVAGATDIMNSDMQFYNYSIGHFHEGGIDYFLAPTKYSFSGFLVYTLADNTTLGAWDAYMTAFGGFGLSIGNVQGLWGDGSNIYLAAGQYVSALSFYTPTPIPEPSTYALMALGLFTALAVARHRQKAAQKTA